MKEIGGYIELDTYMLPMLHEKAIALNCGRNALSYLIEARKIETLLIPHYLCGCIQNVCKKYSVQVKYYHINKNFEPVDINLENQEWLYLVNYYGQISPQKVLELVAKYHNVIVDQAQDYYAEPIENVDTLYTCRKFLGVPDGAFLYTTARLERKLPRDISFERIHYILGRFEKTASEFYNESSYNNSFFDNEPIKEMSKLTWNLLHAIDYERAASIRTRNFSCLDSMLKNINKLKLRIPNGAFMYPLMLENAEILKKELLMHKIYIPTLWPEVLLYCEKNTTAYRFAKEILPLPCDQRYSLLDMEFIANTILHFY